MDAGSFLHEPKASKAPRVRFNELCSSRDQETSCDDPRHGVDGVTVVA
jgi:hypothetical protein